MANTRFNPWIITKQEKTYAEVAEELASNGGWNIQLIENLSENAAQYYADDYEAVKGYDVYFIDFAGYFGYSYVVFYNGHMIRHAADYELHHRWENKTREELHSAYIKAINDKLYTDEELSKPLKDYDDYNRRCSYLNNCYCDRENHISAFHIYHNDEEEMICEEAKKKLTFNPACFGYYESKDFVKKCGELRQAIENAKEKAVEDYDYLDKAFYYEFANYECIYGGRYEEAASAVIGKMKVTETIQRAFKDAKKRYTEWCYAHDLP